MSSDTLKPVDMHEAFKRDPQKRGSATIAYVGLDEAAIDAKSKEMPLLRTFWEYPEGSLEAETWARRAAIGYFVLTAAQLQSAKDSEKPVISDRFTEASIELYGEPDTKVVRHLASLQLGQFLDLLGDEAVDQNRLKNCIDFLESQMITPEYADIDSELIEALREIKNAIEDKYADVLAVFNIPTDRDNTKIPAERVAQLFQEAIDILAATDPAWEGWRAAITDGSTMETDTRKKLVGVGSEPRAVNSLKLSFVHEVLAHALRSVNGSKLGDESLEHGIPGSQDAEEGTAVFFASSLRGYLSDRPKDFYVDIGIALGQLGKKIPRSQMQQYYLDKSIVRAQADRKTVDIDAESKRSWGYVNRMYRGSLGDKNIGVNTFDISYYHGFSKIASYIVEQLKAGVPAQETFDYLVSCRFDPLNPEHVGKRDAKIKSLIE